MGQLRNAVTAETAIVLDDGGEHDRRRVHFRELTPGGSTRPETSQRDRRARGERPQLDTAVGATELEQSHRAVSGLDRDLTVGRGSRTRARATETPSGATWTALVLVRDSSGGV